MLHQFKYVVIKHNNKYINKKTKQISLHICRKKNSIEYNQVAKFTYSKIGNNLEEN